MKGFASSDEHDPRVIVWDVDGRVEKVWINGHFFCPKGTLWLPEMYQLRGGSPFRANEDGDVFDCRGEHVYLLSDAIAVLERIHNEFPHAFVAIASTCDEPEWAKELLKVVKVGLIVWPPFLVYLLICENLLERLVPSRSEVSSEKI
jgi:hypothetical protein